MAARSAARRRRRVAGAAARARGAGRFPERAAADRASARGHRPARHRQHRSPACGCCRRSTGRCSSSASAWSSRCSARIRPGAYAEMDFRDARSLPALDRGAVAPVAGAGARRRAHAPIAHGARGAGARSGKRPAPSRRLLPDLARPVHARRGAALSADACASGWRASSSSIRPSATSGTIGLATALGVAGLLAYAAPARDVHERPVAGRPRSCCCRSASWRSRC